MERTVLKRGWWLLAALPLLIHAYLLYRYAVNAPRLDDFTEILTFLPDWHTASTAPEKLAVFFRDYQNHRYVFYHALLVLFDAVDFRSAAMAGNLALPLLCALLMLATRQHPQRHIVWLMTPWLVFNLQSAHAMFWGPLGTTNLLYPPVALLACWLVTCDKPKLVPALLVCIALTLSHGSGPLLFPVIALHLWQKNGVKSPATLVWLVATVLAEALYFLAFPLHNEAGYSSHGSTELLQQLVTQPALLLQGFLALLGSHLLINDIHSWKESAATAIGAAQLLWLAWLWRRGALRTFPALRLWLLFILLTACSITAGRVAYAGLPQAMQGHYKLLNGILLWFSCTATLAWLAQTRAPWLPRARVATALLVTSSYMAALLLFLRPLQLYQQALYDDVLQWRQSGKLVVPETVLYVKQPNKKLKAAIDGGYYSP